MRIPLILLAAACVVGCSPKTSPRSTSDAICQNGDRCLCGAVAIPKAIAGDWACGDGAWRCFREAGCTVNGVVYPPGVDWTQYGIQCGTQGPLSAEDMPGYRCDTYREQWTCDRETCSCWGKTIAKGKNCASDICLGIRMHAYEGTDSDCLVCDAKGWSVDCDSENHGGVFVVNDWEYDIRNGTRIAPEGAICEGTTPESRAENAKAGRVIATPTAYRIPFEALMDYRCTDIDWNHGNHWVCVNPDGCDCGDARCSDKEYCDNGECRLLPQKCEAGNCPCGDGVCMRGGTCVDGYCICGMEWENRNEESQSPESLSINDYAGFWSDDYENGGRVSSLIVNNNLGDFACEVMSYEGTCYGQDAVVLCDKKEGCHTPDGRHYLYRQTAIGNTHFADEWDEVAVDYHVDAGFDTVAVSSPFGTCVLDRHDGLVRKRDAAGSDTWICDEAECACGEGKCTLGQICRKGVCENDACPIPHASKRLRYVTNEPDCDLSASEEAAGIVDADGYARGKVDETKELECGGNWVWDYDSRTCKGGTRYCRGAKDTESKPIPKDSKHYFCRGVSKPKDTEHKAWKCDSLDECLCGDRFCPYNAFCIDEVCTFDGKPVPEQARRPGCRYTDDGQLLCPGDKIDSPKHEPQNSKPGNWVCEDLAGCWCNDVRCPYGARCQDGKVLCHSRPIPEKDPWNYDCTEDGFWVCNRRGEGCACGDKMCPGYGACENGTCTCNGRNAPAEGYACRGNGEYDWQLVQGMYQSRILAIDLEWQCEGKDGCVCGNTRCREKETCWDGVCSCGGQPALAEGYVCHLSELRPAEWKCTEKDGCACGNTRCRENEACENGSCTCGGLLSPGEDFVCLQMGDDDTVWRCTNPEGCTAQKACMEKGDRVSRHDTCDLRRASHTAIRNGEYYCGDSVMHMENGAYLCTDGRQVCDAASCPCGDTACPKYAVCSDGQCLHPATQKPISAAQDGYYTEGVMRLCMADACPCADGVQCSRGEYCLLEKCQTPEIRFDAGHYYVGTFDDEAPDPDETHLDWPGWQEQYRQYAMQFEKTVEWECSSQEFDWKMRELCANPAGCDCNGARCSLGMECGAKGCEGDGLHPEREICRNVRLNGRTGYVCTDFGWKCTEPQCSCGDQTCAQNEICLAPGICASIRQ